MYCCSVHVFSLSYFADDFLPIFEGLNLPLVTLFAPLWSPLRRLTLSLKKLGRVKLPPGSGLLHPFDLPAMEKLLANSKPSHVICFCKFVEIIPNPITWPRANLH